MFEQAYRHFVAAQCHVVAAEERVMDQRARVEQLAHEGRDTRAAQKLLRVFEESLELMERHLRITEMEYERLCS